MKKHEVNSVMIHLFLDNELVGGERESLISHLENCASCREEMEEARSFSLRLKESHANTEAPLALRERIINHLIIPKNQAIISVPAVKTPTARLSWLFPLAAALLGITIGAVLSFTYLKQDLYTRGFIDTAIVEHRATDNDRPLEIQSNSPGIVTAWFAKRVSFPFRMADAGIAEDDLANYVLIGGRLVKFANEPAALLEFQMPGNRISLLISSNKLAKASGGTITYADGLRFHIKDLDGLHVSTWENKGLTYALISSVAMGSSRSCSACHRGAPTADSAADNASHVAVSFSH